MWVSTRLDYAGRDNVYDGKIHLVKLSYSIDKNVKYEEAKTFFRDIVDGLLDVINKTEYLGKYFYHSPIGHEDLFVSISFDYDQKGILKKDDVYQIAIFENKIMYRFADEEEMVRMKQRKISEDIYIFEGFSPEMRVIVQDLPEKEM